MSFLHSVSLLGAKAYAYSRCSKRKQAEGQTFDRQHEMAEVFATRHGLPLDDELDLNDAGYSAFYAEHRRKGALGKFLALVEAGEIKPGSWLLIESADRLSREPFLHAFDLFRGLLGKGITIAVLNTGWMITEASANDPRQQWMLQALVGAIQLAHTESAEKSRRLKQTKEAKRKRIVEQNSKESHSCPAWLSFDTTRNGAYPYFLNDRAPAFRRMFELAAEHVSQYRIALELAREGHTPPKGGRYWQTSYISKTLRNDAALGVYRPSVMVNGKEEKTGEIVQDHYEPLVSAALFKAANDAKRSRHTSSGNKGKPFKNVFTRACYCGACGSVMVIGSVKKPRGTKSYLICSNKRAQQGCTAERNFRYDHVERGVLRNVTELDLSKLQRDDVGDARITRVNEEIEAADRRAADLSEIIENLLDKIERTKGDAIELEERLAKRKAERGGLRAEASRLREERDRLERERQSRVKGPERVERYLAELQGEEGPELYLKRANLAGVLRSFIDGLILYPNTGEVHVRLWGGRKMYRFHADHPEQAWVEVTITLGNTTPSEVKSYLTEIRAEARDIVAEGPDTRITTDESVAILMKLALHSRSG